MLDHYSASDTNETSLNDGVSCITPNPNITTSEEYITPLMAVSSIGDIYTARILIEYNADINLRDIDKENALDIAESNGNERIINLLKSLCVLRAACL